MNSTTRTTVATPASGALALRASSATDAPASTPARRG